MFKKLFTYTTLVLALFLTPVGIAVAATDPYEDVCDTARGKNSLVCKNEARTDNSNPIAGPDGVLMSVTNIISIIAGAAAVIIIIIAGLQFIMASGDSNNISKARNAIIYAAIGLVVIVLARAIIAFILNRI